MSIEVDRLDAVLSKRTHTPKVGTVHSLSGANVVVSTDTGPVQTAVAGSVVYKKGDRVMLSDGVIVGRIRGGTSTTTYMV